MKFKITNNEMLSLIAIIQLLVQEIKQDAAPEEKLYIALFEEFALKLMQKALLKNAQYSVKFTPALAIAFWINFNGNCAATTQAGNMVQAMCNAIHQQILSK